MESVVSYKRIRLPIPLPQGAPPVSLVGFKHISIHNAVALYELLHTPRGDGRPNMLHWTPPKERWTCSKRRVLERSPVARDEKQWKKWKFEALNGAVGKPNNALEIFAS
uniref:Uncharacterized protein n=1 Tax=Globodera rostochiensis TaxID=31243 RepID=A0A914HVT8_GLORO